jgi:hypothetical protein
MKTYNFRNEQRYKQQQKNRVRKNHCDAQLIFSVFPQTISTCFGRNYSPLSGGTTVCIQQLVFIVLFRQVSVVLAGLELVQPNQDNGQSSKKEP